MYLIFPLHILAQYTEMIFPWNLFVGPLGHSQPLSPKSFSYSLMPVYGPSESINILWRRSLSIDWILFQNLTIYEFAFYCIWYDRGKYNKETKHSTLWYDRGQLCWLQWTRKHRPLHKLNNMTVKNGLCTTICMKALTFDLCWRVETIMFWLLWNQVIIYLVKADNFYW